MSQSLPSMRVFLRRRRESNAIRLASVSTCGGCRLRFIDVVVALIRSVRLCDCACTSLSQHFAGMPGSDKVHRPEMTHHVFMYGTLKRAEANHYHLETTENGHAEFIGAVQTEKSFPLIVATKYNLPFLLWAEGNGHRLQGELYRIDDKMLNWLDDFEGHPNYYERDRVKVVVTEDTIDGNVTKEGETEGRTVECWAYVLKKYPPHMLKRTVYCCYSNDATDGHCYKEEKDTVVRVDELLMLDNNDNIGKGAATTQHDQSAKPRDDEGGPDNFYKLLLEDCR